MAVYFLYAKKAKRIKIGYSNNPKKRICAIQTSSPEKLIQLAVLKGERELEQAIHVRFHYLRENGEWFRAEKELFEWISAVRKMRHIPFVKISVNDKNLEEKRKKYRESGYIIVLYHEDENGGISKEELNAKRTSSHS